MSKVILPILTWLLFAPASLPSDPSLPAPKFHIQSPQGPTSRSIEGIFLTRFDQPY